VVFPWQLVGNPPGQTAGRRWQLFDVESDFSQSRDLAGQHPERLRELQVLFWAEAGRNGALPIHRGEGSEGKPSWIGSRREFGFQPGTARLLTANAPATVNRSFTVRAMVDLSGADRDGMLVTHGGRTGGYGLYILGGRLVFRYNLAGIDQYEIASERPLSASTTELGLEFAYDGGGPGRGATVTLRSNGTVIGQGRVERTLPRFYGLDAMFDVGLDTGSPVSEDYALPFRSSALRRLTFAVDPPATAN
jgi:arylsulfatase